MSQFFPTGSHNLFKQTNPLVPVVRPMPPQARQAMYAAASKGLIARGTWNGCAWNAAGVEHSGHNLITSIEAAAKAFGTTSTVVSEFISVWDELEGSDAYCTELLKEAIDKVGIHAPINSRLVAAVRGYAYRSLDTQFKDELAKVETLADMPGFTNEMVDGIQILLNA